ncbi:hypothetical protein, partial [Vibrio anguillarum]|uniref:hypothetical protein n=1 Tax=Vibrio anguillarum TaxID=55601 RepID=UPI001C050536
AGAIVEKATATVFTKVDFWIFIIFPSMGMIEYLSFALTTQFLPNITSAKEKDCFWCQFLKLLQC